MARGAAVPLAAIDARTLADIGRAREPTEAAHTPAGGALERDPRLRVAPAANCTVSVDLVLGNNDNPARSQRRSS
jgi:hypothetical protein